VGEALPEAEKLLGHICTRSANAIRIGGEVVNAGYDIDLQTACMLERDAFALCFSSFDQREGMQAFLDKRTPHFKGE
jgi:enoyl-CoA hydratase